MTGTKETVTAMLGRLVRACTPLPATADEVAGKKIPRGVRMPEKEIVEEARALLATLQPLTDREDAK